MKKILLMISLVLFSQYLLAQEDTDSIVVKKNMVKLNLPALALKNFTVQYERAVAKKISVAATVRYMPDGSIPLKSTFVKLADNPDTERQLNNLTVGNFAVMPEVRFYLGRKGVFHGFYLGPFDTMQNYYMSMMMQAL